MPSLRELEAYFTKYEDKDKYHHVDTLAEADGVWLLCPACFVKNHGSVGTHMIMVGFVGRCPPGSYTQDGNGNDTRWTVSGTGLDDLQCLPSINLDVYPQRPKLPNDCVWHGFIGAGGVLPGHAQ